MPPRQTPGKSLFDADAGSSSPYPGARQPPEATDGGSDDEEEGEDDEDRGDDKEEGDDDKEEGDDVRTNDAEFVKVGEARGDDVDANSIRVSDVEETFERNDWRRDEI